MSKGEKEYAIKQAEEVSKSIVDGDMYLTKKAYLASLAMYGVTRDMVRYNPATGKIDGFRSGGIKPIIAHSEVVSDKSLKNYGEISEWYGKTAFKYNPLLNQLMLDLGVDAITFGSANKINTLKSGINAESRDRFSTMSFDTTIFFIPINPPF